MYCHNCGAYVPNGRNNCPECGAYFCPEYGRKPCKNVLIIEIKKRHIDIAVYFLAIIAAVFTVGYLAVSTIQWAKAAWMPSPKDIITTDQIKSEDVWFEETGVSFSSYPAEISPGQWAQLNAIGTPDTEYYICVQLGKRIMSASHLMAQTSRSDGNLCWVWKVPDDAPAGIYTIQVFSNNGTENRIDYAVLDRGGKVFGNRPEHEVTMLDPLQVQYDQQFSYHVTDDPESILEPEPILDPDTAPETDIVYITETGEKYHKAGCQYLSESEIAISRSEAIERDYEPCSKCNP